MNMKRIRTIRRGLSVRLTMPEKQSSVCPKCGQETGLDSPSLLEVIGGITGSILCLVLLVVTLQLVTQFVQQRMENSSRSFSLLWADPSDY